MQNEEFFHLVNLKLFFPFYRNNVIPRVWHVGIFFCCFLFLYSCGSQPSSKIEETKVKDSLPENLQRLNESINKEPSNATNYYERALYYIQQKNSTAAFEDINKAIALDSTKSNYYLTLSDVYFMQGQSGNSKNALEKSITLDPHNIEVLLKLAELYLYVQQYKTSIQYVDKVLHINKHFAKGYFIKGMNFKELGDTAKAISSFETTIEQDPDYYAAYIQLGILHAAKHNKIALNYYDNALQINPKSIEAYYNKAIFYQEEGETEKAKDLYETILQLNPSYKYAYYNLGYLDFVNLSAYENALVNFNNAIRCDSDYAEAIYMRGLCYEMQKDYTRASRDYHTALQLEPDYKEPFEGLKRIKK